MKLKHILRGIAAVVLALLLIILLPIDDRLDAGAAAWLESANDIEDVEGNGYYYLMGMMAAPDEDPATVGSALIADHREAGDKLLGGEIVEFPRLEYPKSKQLPKPEGDYYCRMEEAGCFARLSANAAALRAELKTHAVALQRYQRYLQFDRVKPLMKPMLYEPFSPYLYLFRGNKLNQFRILLESQSDRARAVSMLRENMAQVRRHLAEAPNLIAKMVMLGILTDDLDLLLNIARPSDVPAPVPELTPRERALEQVMLREFGHIGNIFVQMEQNPRSLEEDSDHWGISNRLLFAFIKPNMSMNGLFPYYRDIAALAGLDAGEFNRRLEAGGPRVDTGFNLRNIGGSILNSISVPSLIGYVARIHDLNCKIALINAALKLKPEEWNKILNREAELQVNNPYNSSWRPYVDQETQSVCFKGPLTAESMQQRRCIRKDGVI